MGVKRSSPGKWKWADAVTAGRVLEPNSNYRPDLTAARVAVGGALVVTSVVLFVLDARHRPEATRTMALRRPAALPPSEPLISTSAAPMVSIRF